MEEKESTKPGRRDFLLGALTGVAGIAATVHPAAARSTRDLRVGVVGSGHRAQGSHLPILTHYLPRTQLVALCDITPENLRKGLAICGSATVGYATHQEMLAKHPELDAVVVVIPNYKHAEITLDALEAGKHVLCEKPMATHLADATQMLQKAQEKRLILQIGHQLRYATIFYRAADFIRQGRIGTVEYVYAALFRGDWNPNSWQYTDPVTGKETNWRYLTLTEGSALLEDGIHELDIIHWLVGADPKQIQAVGGNNVYRDRQTIDHAGILITFDNGVKCEFGFTIFTPRVRDARVMRIFGSKGEMTVEETSIVIQRYNGQPETFSISPMSAEEEAAIFKGTPNQRGMGKFDIATWREYVDFQHSIKTGNPPFSSGQTGRAAAHISLAAEHSLRTGQVMEWEERNL